MKTIYIVRHGESQENVDKIFSAGRAPLTEKGKKQAEALAERFENIGLDAIFSSHFTRAEQTAQIVAERKNMQYHVLDFTHEHAYLHDELAGKRKSEEEIQKKLAIIKETWLKDEPDDNEINEGYTELISRVDKFIDFINEKEEENILLVTHTMFIFAIVTRVYFKDRLKPSLVYLIRENSKLTNTGISIFLADEEGSWKLKTFNDDLHV